LPAHESTIAIGLFEARKKGKKVPKRKSTKRKAAKRKLPE
jgi:Family of unknown function (DUF6496)